MSVDLDKCHKSLEILIKSNESCRDFPDHPAKLQMLSHIDLRNLLTLLSEAEKRTGDVVEMTKVMYVALSNIKEKLNSKGKREEILAIVDDCLKKTGF